MTRHLTYIFLTIGLISCGLTLDKNEKIKSGEIELNHYGLKVHRFGLAD